MKRKILSCIVIGLSSLFLFSSSVQAGWLKNALVGSALVGAGVAIGKAGAHGESSHGASIDNSIPLAKPSLVIKGAVSTSKAEQKRLNAMEKVTWKLLKKGDFDNPLLPEYAEKLSGTNELTKLDASAFIFAELGDKDKAISIYQERMLSVFKSIDVSEIEIEVYDRRYGVLENCIPRSCVTGL